MKVLIPGGFGFLGGRLGQFLVSQGSFSVVLGTRQQISAPAWLPNAQTVRTCWDSETDLERVCAGVDVIVQSAGMNAQACASDPVAALEFNALATARLVHAASRQGVQRFVYVSTAHVYGSPLSGKITEQTCPGGLHPYATSHRAAEDAVLAAGQTGRIESLVVRLSNAFGAPVRKEADCWMLLINDLCRQAVTSQRMVLRSTGLQNRDFVPLSEACRAIAHLLRLPHKHHATGIFNVGGASMPVWDAAMRVRERCESVLGYAPTIERVSPQAGDEEPALDYRIEALRNSGFEPRPDSDGEIDRLLAFCAESFK